jgi:type I restriction enzyme R subunit
LESNGTQFRREDFIRFEQVNRTMVDEDMAEMLDNNPPDVCVRSFLQSLLEGRN